MTEGFFKHYEEFYNMLLSVTIMGNAKTKELEEDAKKIIKFIGDAYKLEDTFVAQCEDIILNELITLGLSIDQTAVYSSRAYGDEFTDKDVLFDIKGDVLNKLQGLSRIESPDVNSAWFDYTHYKTYEPHVRFYKIKRTSATGNLIATRQMGILLALGIGCQKDLNQAVTRLLQCAFWGDVPSMYYLSYVYGLLGDEAQCKEYYEVTELLEKYFFDGCTVLPEEVKKKYSEKACNDYIYIASIKQDVVYAYNKQSIDFSFLEAIFSPTLDYYKRIDYINKYDRKEWKEVTNSSKRPNENVGFKFGFR